MEKSTVDRFENFISACSGVLVGLLVFVVYVFLFKM